MLEFFVIFSKSGIVLFATVNQSLNQVVNGLVKHVFLEERTGQYTTEQLQIKYHMDNEFELVYVVGYQKFLTLGYVDKFLDEIHRAFRDKYNDYDLRKILNTSFTKQRSKILKVHNSTELSTNFGSKTLQKGQKKLKTIEFCDLVIDDESSILDFSEEFGTTYERCVRVYGTVTKQDTMRTFQDSAKSKKTIASITAQPEQKESTKAKSQPEPAKGPENVPPGKSMLAKISKPGEPKFVKKAKKSAAGDKEPSKKGKAARMWELSGSNPDEFDFSKKSSGAANEEQSTVNTASINKNIASTMSLEDLETNLEITDSESSEDDEDENIDDDAEIAGKLSKSSYLSSVWKTISYNKTLTEEDLTPVLDQLRDHLTSKNVAASIARELCNSVRDKLKGQSINTWVNLKKFARTALEDAVLGILNTGRNINILREIQAKARPPYVIVFCGVNGVGKSTNLAKIANWLINNNVKVLVVACDTFRAGAIEQLRTHVMALKSLHEKRAKNTEVKIELFEKGYGRDSAAIAMEAINYARNNKFNCVMVDTAGRMQDNEPLMKQLAKLITINNPDLTLFVGEALVGNEAVDQLTKFNDSLVENGCRLADSARSAINGIVLTKFDTIDDQVGAAISMTYVTCKPIVFVGVGQTYRDLKQLDAKAVTRALMR